MRPSRLGPERQSHTNTNAISLLTWTGPVNPGGGQCGRFICQITFYVCISWRQEYQYSCFPTQLMHVGSEEMKKRLLITFMIICGGCSQQYKPRFKAELIKFADPVVKKWHTDGFTLNHAFSERFYEQAERYVAGDLQPFRELLDSRVRSTGEYLAEIDSIRSHYASSQYSTEAYLLYELLDPRAGSVLVCEPTNGWSLSSEGAPSLERSP